MFVPNPETESAVHSALMNVRLPAASTKNVSNPSLPESVNSILAGILRSIVPEPRPISNAKVSLNVVVVEPLV